MKKTRLFYFVTLSVLFFSQSLLAQKVTSVSGDADASFLYGQKELNVQYQYDGMVIGKDKETEEHYVSEKVTEYNKKEAGKGDKWKEGWIGARKARYQPKFEELINKELEKTGLVTGEKPSAKYTLIVKTTFTEPGYNVGMMKYPAFANLEFVLVETANPSNVLSKFTLEKLMGSQAMGFDFDAGSRIAESYAKGGKVFGQYIYSHAFKKKK